MIHIDEYSSGKKIYKRYWCPVPKCETWKYSYEELKDHIRYFHEADLIENEFKCERCKKGYKTVRRLAKHKCTKGSPRLQEFKEKILKQTTLLDLAEI